MSYYIKKNKKPNNVCIICGEQTKMLCVKCKKIYYCSKKCQSKDHKFHKKYVCNLSILNNELAKLETINLIILLSAKSGEEREIIINLLYILHSITNKDINIFFNTGGVIASDYLLQKVKDEIYNKNIPYMELLCKLYRIYTHYVISKEYNKDVYYCLFQLKFIELSAYINHSMSYEEFYSEYCSWYKKDNTLCCEVRKSNIHGNGVFATKDIKKGEIICFYDGVIITKEEYQETKSLNIVDTGTIIVKGYEKEYNPIGVGQFINDYAKIDLTGDRENMLNQICDYYDNDKTNVSFNTVEGKILIVSKEDIKKDEEILCLYNHSYWIGNHEDYSDGSLMNEIDKLYIYMKDVISTLYKNGYVKSLNLKENIKVINDHIRSLKVGGFWMFKTTFK